MSVLSEYIYFYFISFYIRRAISTQPNAKKPLVEKKNLPYIKISKIGAIFTDFNLLSFRLVLLHSWIWYNRVNKIFQENMIVEFNYQFLNKNESNMLSFYFEFIFFSLWIWCRKCSLVPRNLTDIISNQNHIKGKPANGK